MRESTYLMVLVPALRLPVLSGLSVSDALTRNRPIRNYWSLISFLPGIISKFQIVSVTNFPPNSVHYVSGMLVAEQRIKYMTSFMSLVDACIVMAFIIDMLIHFVSKDPPDWVSYQSELVI